jgi:hypothetical protein
MVEEASAEVMAERQRLAERVRNELVAAGLPVVFPQLLPLLSQGPRSVSTRLRATTPAL